MYRINLYPEYGQTRSRQRRRTALTAGLMLALIGVTSVRWLAVLFFLVGLIGDAVRIDPGFAAAWGNLGVARRRVGDLPGAFDAYLLAPGLALPEITALEVSGRIRRDRGGLLTLAG